MEITSFHTTHNIDISANSTQKIRSLRNQFLKSISAAGHDTEDLEGKSLKELADYIKNNKIQIAKHLRQTDDNYSDDVKFIRKQNPDISSKDIRKNIVSVKSKYIKAITAAGKKLEDIEKKSLAELADISKAKQLQCLLIQAKRQNYVRHKHLIIINA